MYPESERVFLKTINEIGVNGYVDKQISKINFPIYAAELNEYQILVFDRQNYNQQLIVIDEISKGITAYPFTLPNNDTFVSIKKTLLDHFIGVTNREHRIYVFSDKGITKCFFLPETHLIFVDMLNDSMYIGIDKSNDFVIFDEKNIIDKVNLKEKGIGEVSSIALTPKGTVLMTDEDYHHVLELNIKNFEFQLYYGETGVPGKRITCLASPQAAEQTLGEDERCLIADSLNNRIIEVNGKKEVVWVFEGLSKEDTLFFPTHACRRKNGDILISDTKNGRILVIDSNKKIKDIYGRQNRNHHVLSHPRTIQILEKERSFLVADTLNNRVIEIDENNHVKWTYTDLYWPRSAEKQEDGSILICDSLNKRIVLLSEQGDVITQIRKIKYNHEEWGFLDPHYATRMNNAFLVVDSNLNQVLVMRSDGTALNLFGGGNITLKDPHFADWHGEFIIIADTGNNRMLLFKNNAFIREIKVLNLGGKVIRFFQLRFCKFISGEYVFLIDGFSGNGYEIDFFGNIKRIFIPTDKDLIEAMRHTRCVVFGQEEMFVSDNNFSRILHVINL